MRLKRLFLALSGHICPPQRPAISFFRATLCEDCKLISESLGPECPFCHSRAVILLCQNRDVFRRKVKV